MSRTEYTATEAARQAQLYRCELIHAQYQIALLTSRPVSLSDLQAIALQLADRIAP